MIGTVRSETTPSAANHARLTSRVSAGTSAMQTGSLWVMTQPATESCGDNRRFRPAVPRMTPGLRAQLQELARVVEQPDAGDVGADARLCDLGQSVEHLAEIERGGEEPARLGQHLELARPLVELFVHPQPGSKGESLPNWGGLQRL